MTKLKQTFQSLHVNIKNFLTLIMVEIIQEDLKITITIKCYDNEAKDKYLGLIQSYKDCKCISPVQASSIGECIKEIGISLSVLEEYRKQTKKI